jgi:hypothetical protein
MAFFRLPFGYFEYRIDSRDPRQPKHRPVRPVRRAAR